MVKKTDASVKLADIAVHGMQEKKAKNIVKIDLRKLGSAVTDFFVICHGDSDRQIEAIADSVEHEIQKATGEKPFSREGYKSSDWVLLDYVNVVIHVFLREKREFYGIEDLWNDGIITEFNEEGVGTVR